MKRVEENPICTGFMGTVHESVFLPSFYTLTCFQDGVFEPVQKYRA